MDGFIKDATIERLLQQDPALARCKVRVDAESQRGSLIDIIRRVTGGTSSNAQNDLKRIFKKNPELEKRCANIRINGTGRICTVADAPVAIDIILTHPCDAVKAFRLEYYRHRPAAGISDVHLQAVINKDLSENAYLELKRQELETTKIGADVELKRQEADVERTRIHAATTQKQSDADTERLRIKAHFKLRKAEIKTQQATRPSHRRNPLTKTARRLLWDTLVGKQFFAKCMGGCKDGAINPIGAKYLPTKRHEASRDLVSPENIKLVCKQCMNNSMHMCLVSPAKEKTRVLTWLNTNGPVYEAKCYCCRTVNFNFYHGWDAGHVMPSSKDGCGDFKNLRPICKDCNMDMGTEHMETYINNNNYNTPDTHPGDTNSSRSEVHNMYKKLLNTSKHTH
jgi:hypothetical protein